MKRHILKSERAASCVLLGGCGVRRLMIAEAGDVLSDTIPAASRVDDSIIICATRPAASNSILCVAPAAKNRACEEHQIAAVQSVAVRVIATSPIA